MSDLSRREKALRQYEWMRDALCAGQDVNQFFSDSEKAIAAAKEFCGHCPVREECRDYAARTNTRYGVWGGEDFDEGRRDSLRRAHRKSQHGTRRKAEAGCGCEFCLRAYAEWSERRCRIVVLERTGEQEHLAV